MKPSIDRALEVSAIALMTRLGPALPSRFEQSTAGALGALLLAVREEFERGAARRVEENAAIRALFGRAHALVTDAELAERIREAGEGASTDLAITALERENETLRALLIALHAHLEEIEGSDAEAIVEAIWRELARSTERRRLGMAVF